MPIAPILFTAWATIALVLAGRLLFGAWSVRRIVRRARRLDDAAWQTPLYEIADRLGLEEAPQLLQSSDVKMPFAAGLFSSTIVLPVESESWSADRRSAVLVHELGHVRRRDLIGHTLGRIACALYWFHPLVWTAARRLRAESEQACDDLALTFGARPSDYAEHLLDIVTCVRNHNTPWVALAMAHRKEFEGRMLAILNPELPRRAPSRAGTASYAMALAGLALLIGAATPVARPSSAVGQQATDQRQVVQDTASAPVANPTPEPRPDQAANPDPKATANVRTNSHTASSISTDVSTRTDMAIQLQFGKDGKNLAKIADSAVVRALMARLRDEDPEVREAAAHALGRIGDPMAIPDLVRALDDSQPKVQEAVLDALSEFERGVPEAPIRRMLTADNANMRERAIDILSNMHAKGSLQAITKLVADPNADVRQRAISTLEEFGDPSSAAAILPALNDPAPDVRQEAIQALAELGGTVPDATLDKLVRDQHADVRQATVQFIEERRVVTMTPQLISLLDDSSGDVREAAAQALTEIRSPESHAALRRALNHSDSKVRRIAVDYFGEEGKQ